MAKTITQLPSAAAPTAQYVVAADNAAGTVTEKVTLGQLVAPAMPPASMSAGLTVTFTGGLYSPLQAIVYPPDASYLVGSELYSSNDGYRVFVGSLNANAVATPGSLEVTGATAVDYPGLLYTSESYLTGISAPQAKRGNLFGQTATHNVLTFLLLPEYEYGAPLGSSNNFPALASLSLPKWKAGGSLRVTAHALTTFSVPLLWHCGSILMAANSLTSFSFPSLAVVDGITLSSTSATSASFPGLEVITAPAFSITCPAMTTITMPPIGQLKAFCGTSNGPSINAALDQESVDAILNRFAYLDGNNGTRLFGSPHTLSITGTSAAPSDQGSTTVAGSSFVCSGTTCTVNWPAHGYATGDVLRVSGVLTATNANRYAAITVLSANQFRYTITSQNATGTGTATVRKASDDVKALVTRGVTLTTN